jgi:hypothetical protein
MNNYFQIDMAIWIMDHYTVLHFDTTILLYVNNGTLQHNYMTIQKLPIDNIPLKMRDFNHVSHHYCDMKIVKVCQNFFTFAVV